MSKKPSKTKQMFISCGQDEPLKSPLKAYFICVIGIYFVSFFYEHPVERAHLAFLTTLVLLVWEKIVKISVFMMDMSHV